MLALAPLIAACVRRLDAGLAPSGDDVESLDRALADGLDDDDLIALARLVSDRRHAPSFGGLDQRLRGVLESKPAARQRCELEVDVPALRAAPADALRQTELFGLYAWTEHAGDTSFARTNTTLLLLGEDGAFARGAGTPGFDDGGQPAADNPGDRGVWSGAYGRILMASDCGRHESYAYIRNVRTLILTDDQGVRRLLRPISDGH